jgi:hypothetical protein
MIDTRKGLDLHLEPLQKPCFLITLYTLDRPLMKYLDHYRSVVQFSVAREKYHTETASIEFPLNKIAPIHRRPGTQRQWCQFRLDVITPLCSDFRDSFLIADPRLLRKSQRGTSVEPLHYRISRIALVE